MAGCELMRCATVVSNKQSKARRDWIFNVKLDSDDSGCLEKIIRARGFKATETEDGYTIFEKS